MKTKTYVNLGCGNHIVPSTKGIKWINIDNYYIEDVPNFLKGDARNIPLPNESVDYILLDQVLEHIPMADVPLVLWEIRRVLKTGGKCVIIVPDFEDAVRQWLAQPHNLSFEPMRYKWFSEVVYGNQEHEGEFHKTPMCAGYLHFNLNMVGLTKHQIDFHAAFSDIPRNVEGMRNYLPEAILRNAQLLVRITK
jgi:predicted SAM-dependent methyltransferase